MDVISVDEFLRVPKEDVEARDGEELLLEPDTGNFQRLFRRVNVGSFEDMQKLELIPRQLREEQVLRAIASDDEAALELAGKIVGSGSRPSPLCSCSERAPGSAAREKETNPVVRAFAEVRSYHNPNLAKLMSESMGTPARWNDVHVAQIHKRVQTAIAMTPALQSYYLGTLADLVIGKNATVTLSAAVKAIYGNGLKIHKGGKLIVKGSGVKLRFLSAQGGITSVIAPALSTTVSTAATRRS